MNVISKLKGITLLIWGVLQAGTYMCAYADTGLIRDVDVTDTWKYNFNASHWIEQGNIHAGIPMYGEADIAIRTLSKELAGADWIQTAYGSKAFTGGVIATFTLAHDAAIYIAHAKTITVKPAWLKAFAKTNYTLVNAHNDKFEVYSRKYRRGDTVKLGANGSTTQSMYIVLAKPTGTLPVKTTPPGKVFDAAKYGAVGDGKTINTQPLQAAIDACNAAGGGSVYIHNGVFMTGSLVLKDNVTLYVEAGAVLRGSHRPEDYPEHRPSLPSYRSHEAFQLIYAEKAKNIRITGGGVIDGNSQGNGQPWSNKLDEISRPRLIRMSECKDVRVDHITLIRSVCWTQYYEGCENLKENDIHIRCYTGQDNQDGIDISGCKNVEVSNYHAITGDDGICIKSMSMKTNENLYIHDIFIRYSNCHAIKIGTETHGDVRHVRVNNVVASARYGTAVESVDGATVEDVIYDGIVLKDCGVPIFIRLGQRGRVFKGGPEVAATSKMRNITIRNLTNTGINYVDTRDGPGVGSVISGLPGQEIENLTIENCNFLYYGSLRDPTLVNREIPENPAMYPEFNLLGICPTYGLFTRHVRGLTYKNIRVNCKYIDARPGIILDDVKGYTLSAVKTESFPITKPYPIWHKQDGQLQQSFASDKK